MRAIKQINALVRLVESKKALEKTLASLKQARDNDNSLRIEWQGGAAFVYDDASVKIINDIIIDTQIRINLVDVVLCDAETALQGLSLEV